ncbi:hypothetical protein [Streptomyces sp. NPDC059278]|uniref:hypothetical protein n=1 Tax=Streptomyces sp. NPDC059278 TaxID=3346801 RepID=UPI0036D034FB
MVEVGVGPCAESDHHNRLGPTPGDKGPTAAAVTKALTTSHADGAQRGDVLNEHGTYDELLTYLKEAHTA